MIKKNACIVEAQSKRFILNDVLYFQTFNSKEEDKTIRHTPL